VLRRPVESALGRPIRSDEDGESGARGCIHNVIASQRVRAKSGPMTGSAKQSRIAFVVAVWIASSLQRKIASQFRRELLAMTEYQVACIISNSQFEPWMPFSDC
jgi:hypothetical protein